MDTASTSDSPPDSISPEQLAAVRSALARRAVAYDIPGAAMPVYDALYAWCRGAQGEPHSWNPELMKGKTP